MRDPVDFLLLSTTTTTTSGPLEWWVENSLKLPILAHLAADILCIPAMSAEVERLFSSVELMLPAARNRLLDDGIEASECILNWHKNDSF